MSNRLYYMILTVIVLFRGSSIFILSPLRGGEYDFSPGKKIHEKQRKNRGKKKVKNREKRR